MTTNIFLIFNIFVLFCFSFDRFSQQCLDIELKACYCLAEKFYWCNSMCFCTYHCHIYVTSQVFLTPNTPKFELPSYACFSISVCVLQEVCCVGGSDLQSVSLVSHALISVYIVMLLIGLRLTYYVTMTSVCYRCART